MSPALPWRRALPPAEPPLADLVKESEQRAQAARLAREWAYGADLGQVAAERLGHFAYIDSLKPPRDPDPVVFGPYYPRGSENAAAYRCAPCGTAWATYAGDKCWVCGKPAADY